MTRYRTYAVGKTYFDLFSWHDLRVYCRMKKEIPRSLKPGWSYYFQEIMSKKHYPESQAERNLPFSKLFFRTRESLEQESLATGGYAFLEPSKKSLNFSMSLGVKRDLFFLLGT